VTDKVEKLARIIAGAVTGIDPDTRISPIPQREVGYVAAWVIQPEASIRPLWTWYAPVAEAVLAAGFDCAGDLVAVQPGDPGAVPAGAVAWSEIDRDAKQAANDGWRERMGLA
jgi:hypothetical protein